MLWKKFLFIGLPIIWFVALLVLVFGSGVGAARKAYIRLYTNKANVLSSETFTLSGRIYPTHKNTKVYIYRQLASQSKYFKIATVRTNSQGVYRYNTRLSQNAKFKTTARIHLKKVISSVKYVNIYDPSVPSPTVITPTPINPSVIPILAPTATPIPSVPEGPTPTATPAPPA